MIIKLVFEVFAELSLRECTLECRALYGLKFEFAFFSEVKVDCFDAVIDGLNLTGSICVLLN